MLKPSTFWKSAIPAPSGLLINAIKHPTELAMLRGARLVTSTETESNRNWAEAKIKMLTGGDPVSARFMRQDFFDYVPQFKLMISGNHKPGLRSVDEAIKSRVNIIPFAVTIPPEERDMELGNKLVTEYPGILAWMIQGCLDGKRPASRPRRQSNRQPTNILRVKTS
jgi:putative DNA primase/helicase